MSSVPYRNDYLALSPPYSLKNLEGYCVYNVATDDLYEISDTAFRFLCLCDGTRRLRDLHYEEEFLATCLSEGILVFHRSARKRNMVVADPPHPSLRYLELQITTRCNLQCKHCYLGSPVLSDLPLANIRQVIMEFAQLQGLRLILSGGEPMLHPDFWQLNEMLPDLSVRSILLSNGGLITGDTVQRLNVHEVQISLDGLEESHDYLRGDGSYQKAVGAIRTLQSLEKDVSVATMVTAKNLTEFPNLEEVITSLGVKEWNVDVPVIAGNLARHNDLQVPYWQSAPMLRYGFGGGLYASSARYTCGSHLCAVAPDGKVAKCAFFAAVPVGDITEGLRRCWERIHHIGIDELRCECDVREECRGGCRFRAQQAGDIYGPDPVQCCLREVQ
jgi:radical SAM protein with 4Fe4S-binding SPASM domain